ncbi:hypothetical protein Q5752_000255 [Cryptotrichosporon argae]
MTLTRQRSLLRLSVLGNVVLASALLALAHLATSPDAAALAGIPRTQGVRQWLPRLQQSFRPSAVASRRCGMCDVDPGLCDEFGRADVERAVAFAGSNVRLRRVLAKMRTGKPFTVAVIGGSVSRGHGLGAADYQDSPANMHHLVFSHLNATFPAPRGSVIGAASDGQRNAFVNGALPATGSDYYSYCFHEHVPPEPDLVLLELAINDEYLVARGPTYERLVRALLDLPSRPAVLNLNIFALRFKVMANGGDIHSAVAQHLDTPVVSVRNLALNHVLADVDTVADWFVRDAPGDNGTIDGIDTRHFNRRAHAVSGRLVNAYIDTQLCEMDRLEAAAPSADIDALYPLVPLPDQLIFDQYQVGAKIPPLSPQCFSTNSGKNKLVPKAHEWRWEDKNYLVSNTTGATIAFDFETAFGRVELFYLRSASFGLGNVQCWVDDDTDAAVTLEGYWDQIYNIGRSSTIRDGLEPGAHVLHCALLESTADPTGGKEFRIISLMSPSPRPSHLMSLTPALPLTTLPLLSRAPSPPASAADVDFDIDALLESSAGADFSLDDLDLSAASPASSISAATSQSPSLASPKSASFDFSLASSAAAAAAPAVDADALSKHHLERFLHYRALAADADVSARTALLFASDPSFGYDALSMPDDLAPFKLDQHTPGVTPLSAASSHPPPPSAAAPAMLSMQLQPSHAPFFGLSAASQSAPQWAQPFAYAPAQQPPAPSPSHAAMHQHAYSAQAQAHAAQIQADAHYRAAEVARAAAAQQQRSMSINSFYVPTPRGSFDAAALGAAPMWSRQSMSTSISDASPPFPTTPKYAPAPVAAGVTTAQPSSYGPAALEGENELEDDELDYASSDAEDKSLSAVGHGHGHLANMSGGGRGYVPGQANDPKKRHRCAVCGRGFARAFNLKSHLATHDPLRPKPHQCPHPACKRGFSRLHDLERHRQGIHSDGPLVDAKRQGVSPSVVRAQTRIQRRAASGNLI